MLHHTRKLIGAENVEFVSLGPSLSAFWPVPVTPAVLFTPILVGPVRPKKQDHGSRQARKGRILKELQ
jgi:hypothetical protein